MNFQSLCPYGLRSLMECICRATLLSQPTNIPDFLLQYLLELISFRESHPEVDPMVIAFHYQELWERKFLRKETTETPIATTETSQAEIEEALKMLYSDLASSIKNNTVKQLQSQKESLGTQEATRKAKKPSATLMNQTPIPPPRVGRQIGKNVPPPFLVVKGDGKPAPPPRDVSVKTRKVSSVRFPCQQQSKETTVDVMKMPKTRQLIPIPIPKKSTPSAASASKSSAASKPSKLPSIPVLVTQKLVLPPIPQKKNRGGQLSTVQSKSVSAKPAKGSPMNRKVESEKTSSRSPVRRALETGAVKAKAKPKGATVPRPESSQEPRQPETESSSAGSTTPKAQEADKKNRIRPYSSPERRGSRVLWAERERVKPIVHRTVGDTEGIHGTAFSRSTFVVEGTNNFNPSPVSSPNHTSHPHLPHAIHVIRYKRIQVRSSPLGLQ